jgi:hypothetical protein
MARKKRGEIPKVTEPQAVETDAISSWPELEETEFMTAKVVDNEPEMLAQSGPEEVTWPRTQLILLSELINALTLSSRFAELINQISGEGGIVQEDGTDAFVRLSVAPGRLDYSSMIRIFPEALPRERLERSLRAGVRQIINGDLEALWIGSETALILLHEA